MHYLFKATQKYITLKTDHNLGTRSRNCKDFIFTINIIKFNTNFLYIFIEYNVNDLHQFFDNYLHFIFAFDLYMIYIYIFLYV